MEPTPPLPDHAGVHLLPPMVLWLMVVASLGADYLLPLPLGFGMAGSIIGMVVGIDALALIIWSAASLKKAGTNVPPNRPTRLIVTDGIFGLSRNPIYIGFILAHAAMALLFDSLWLALWLPVFFLYLNGYVIPKEEAYLTRKFEEAYAAYCARVRRWL